MWKERSCQDGMLQGKRTQHFLNKGEEEEHQLISSISAMSINNPLTMSNQHQLQHGSAQAVHSLYSNVANQPTPTMLL